jgi:hypothetical protein
VGGNAERGGVGIAESREQRAESREQRTESKKQRAEGREQRAESRERYRGRVDTCALAGLCSRFYSTHQPMLTVLMWASGYSTPLL